MQHWLYLFFAIAFEVAGTTSMKLSEGFSRWLPSTMIFVFYAISFTFLTLALKRLDLSVAYAIWAGLGTALITAIGFIWFKEPVTALKCVCVCLIVAGVVGLKAVSSAH